MVCTIPFGKLQKIWTVIYSKEPKSVTSSNKFTFFREGINQSEVEDSFQLASDCVKSARKNVNKLKAVTPVRQCNFCSF